MVGVLYISDVIGGFVDEVLVSGGEGGVVFYFGVGFVGYFGYILSI